MGLLGAVFGVTDIIVQIPGYLYALRAFTCLVTGMSPVINWFHNIKKPKFAAHTACGFFSN